MESDETGIENWWMIGSPTSTKTLKLALEKLSLYDHKRKIVHLQNDSKKMAIPVKSNIEDALQNNKELKSLIENTSETIEVKNSITIQSKNHRTTPRDNLINNLRELFQTKGLVMSNDHIREVPKNWEKHGDFILLSEKCFSSEDWSKLGEELWFTVACILGAQRLGRKSVITDNGYRSPKVSLLCGDNGWVTHVDNGITYTYDVTKCMFSSGNITEKIRVGNFDCVGQTVVDLFAGIGYFVLPYLVKAGASLVYACEWNPDAIEALRRNVEINGVKDKCIVVEGDNRQFPYSGIADHINLGLIPSSEFAWPVACAALKKDVGGWLHIHGNITSYGTNTENISQSTSELTNPTCNHRLKHEWLEWCSYVVGQIKKLLMEKTPSSCVTNQWEVRVEHVEHVKSYAPHIDHLVLDVNCRRVRS